MLKLEYSIFLQNWEISLATIISICIATLIYVRTKQRFKTKDVLQNEVNDYTDGYNDDIVDDLTPALEEKDHIPYLGAVITLPQGAEQFYNMMNNRRSARSFSTKPVSLETIKMCIRAAATSPSGAHTEPWSFCLVSDMVLKNRIREIIETEEYVNYSQRMNRQWTTDLKPLRTNHIKKYITDAPNLILVFKQTYGCLSDGRRRQHYYNEISVSISVGILLGALQSAGFNSLVTTPLNCGPKLRLLLKRPDNEKLLVLLPVGYCSDDCKVPDLQRKDVSEYLIEY